MMHSVSSRAIFVQISFSYVVHNINIHVTYTRPHLFCVPMRNKYSVFKTVGGLFLTSIIRMHPASSGVSWGRAISLRPDTWSVLSLANPSKIPTRPLESISTLLG